MIGLDLRADALQSPQGLLPGSLGSLRVGWDQGELGTARERLPKRIPCRRPNPSAGSETSPISCAAPGSGASAAALPSMGSRRPSASAAISRNLGMRAHATGIEHMFVYPGGKVKKGSASRSSSLDRLRLKLLRREADHRCRASGAREMVQKPFPRRRP